MWCDLMVSPVVSRLIASCDERGYVGSRASGPRLTSHRTPLTLHDWLARASPGAPPPSLPVHGSTAKGEWGDSLLCCASRKHLGACAQAGLADLTQCGRPRFAPDGSFPTITVHPSAYRHHSSGWAHVAAQSASRPCQSRPCPSRPCHGLRGGRASPSRSRDYGPSCDR